MFKKLLFSIFTLVSVSIFHSTFTMKPNGFHHDLNVKKPKSQKLISTLEVDGKVVATLTEDEDDESPEEQFVAEAKQGNEQQKKAPLKSVNLDNPVPQANLNVSNKSRLADLCAKGTAPKAENHNYELSVKKLRDHDDLFKIKVIKKALDRKSSQTCSLVANFAKQTITDKQNLFAPFQINKKSQHATFVDPDYPDCFLWQIPEFGLLKLHRDGSTFFGHSDKDVPLTNDKLTLYSTGKLFLETLKTKALHVKSQESQLCKTLVTDQLQIDNNMLNSGGLKTKQLLGQGTLLNEALVEFDGTPQNYALLGIKTFQNKKNKHSSLDANVISSNLFVSNTNQLFKNKTGALCKVDDLIIDQAKQNSKSVFSNKGSFKTNQINVKRKVINDGSITINGDTSLTNATLVNNGDMLFKQGKFVSTNAKLQNNGNWLMEGIKSTPAPLDIDSLFDGENNDITNLDMENNGVLELKNNKLNFYELTNNKDLLLKSGTYEINKLTNNNTLQLLDNDWLLTDYPQDGKNVIKFPLNHLNSTLGNIECEKNLRYNLGVAPSNITIHGDLEFLRDHNRHITELLNIKSPNKVTVHCYPFEIHDVNEFPNIGHLELFAQGPCAVYKKLTAPQLTLHVNGSLTTGKDNNNFGSIAATHGKLTIDAHDIDGRYGRFYSKDTTMLESTKGDIVIGAEKRGINEDIMKQCIIEWLQNCGINTSCSLGAIFVDAMRQQLEGFDYTLDVRNGAYVTSDNNFILKSAANIFVKFGLLKSMGNKKKNDEDNDLDDLFASILSCSNLPHNKLIAQKEIENLSGEIASHGPISIQCDTYNHTRKGSAAKPCPTGYFEYPGSGPAQLASLDKIDFKVNKIKNVAGSMRSSGDKGISINGKDLALEKGKAYTGESLTYYSRLWNANGVGNGWGAVGSLILNQSPITQSAGDFTINLDGCVITGNIHAGGKFAVHANTGLFKNNKRTRQTLNPTEPTIKNLTETMYHQIEQQPDMYRISADNDIKTEFPLGHPSRPQDGDTVWLNNPTITIPFSLKDLKNPLSGINLELLLQQQISNLAGKAYLGNAKGNKIATVLWANANQWRKEHGKEVMPPEELQNIKRSMLLSQIVYHGMTPLQHLLLCIAPNDMNPYQDNDIVADAVELEFNEQTHQNNRIVATGPEGITITSKTDDATFETQSYTVRHETKDLKVVQQIAMPQQQLIAQAGPINVIAYNNVNRTGTLMAAVGNINEHAQTGSVNKNPLVLQTFVEKCTKNEGFFSSSETVSTSLTHQAQPSTTISGAILHDKAAIAITAIAPQDSAQEKIIYEAPDISIEGLLVADRHTTQSSSSSAFSEQSSFSSKETPYAIPSTIKAPIIQIEGERARINANIIGRELHDNTTQGAQFIAKVAQMLCSGQILVDSPMMSVDAGYEAGYETMIQPMLMVEKIIRAQDTGRMLFESAIMDKDKTEIIGKFVETTYHLKQWQTSWHNVSQVVPNEALVVVAFAIAIATQGAGFELLGGMLNNIAATAGMQLSAAGIAAVNAGFSAVCASTTTSLLQTGDPLQTIKQQFSPEQLKSVAFKMASAGLCAQLGETLNVNMKTEFKSFTEHVCEHAIHNTVDTLLNLAINRVSVEKSLGEMSKDVPLKAVAAYVANKIGAGCTDAITRKTAHTVLGGLSGFAMQHNRDGIFAGAVGALTAETIGDMLISDAQEISIAASTKLKNSGKPLTPENLERAIDAEVHAKTKWAKIAGGTAAVLTKQNASIALSTASNVIDHDVAIRGKLYALEAFQSMVAATSQAMATLSIYSSANADKEKTKEVQKKHTRKKIKPITKNKQLEKVAYDLTLHNIQAQSHVDAYDDIILEHAQEQLESEFNDMAYDLTLHHIETQSRSNAHGEVLFEHAKQKHISEIKQRELWSMIKDDRIYQRALELENIIKNPSLSGISKYLLHNLVDAANDTIDLFAMVPSPVGIACFASSTGRNLYQEKTTPGEVMFNLALGYGILKGVQYTGRGIKFIYQHGKELAKDVTNKVLMTYTKWRVLQNIEASKAAREAPNFLPYPLYPNRSTGGSWLEVESIETLSLDEIRTIQDEVLMYVINKDRQLIITNPLRNRYDHSHLGKGEPVYAAGDIYINNGKITRVDNRSGSYQPSGPQLGNLIENDLYKNGFTEVRGKYIDWLETTDKAYKALLKQYVLSNIAASKIAREASKLRIPFVENPYAVRWTEATVSGSLALHDCPYYAFSYNAWKKNPKAPFDVMGHGLEHIIQLETMHTPRHGLSQKNLQELQKYGKVDLNEVQLLRLMRAYGYKKGQSINLSACLTGSRPDGLAQKLANRANVPVSAPTEDIGFRIFTPSKDPNVFLLKPSFEVISENGTAGIIKTFYPQKKNALTSARQKDSDKVSHLIEPKQVTTITDSAKILVANKSEKISSNIPKEASGKVIIKPGPHGRYEDVSYHKQYNSGQKNAAPKDGQKALDNSVRYSENSPNRVATENGCIVVLRETGKDSGIFHGTIQTWEQTPQPMKNALIKNGFVDHKGKILK